MKNEVIINRIEWLDYIKGILILMVVFGHTIAGSRSQEVNIFGISHYYIYTIHMPMFIFISGYFSKYRINFRDGINNYIG